MKIPMTLTVVEKPTRVLVPLAVRFFPYFEKS